MPIPFENVLVDGQPFQSDGTTTVQTVRANTPFSSQAVAKTVCEARRCVVHNGGRVYLTQERFSDITVLGDDAIGVVAPKAIDMRNGCSQIIYNAHR